MVPQLMKAFDINLVEMGVLSASFSFLYIVMQIPSGILVDRIGPRRLLSGALIIVVCACLVFSVAKVYSVAAVARLLIGFGSAPAIVCTLYVAAKWFPHKQFALIVGLTEFFGMLGGAAGESGLALLVEALGWRETMLICSLIGGVLLVLTLLLVHDKPKEQETESANERISVLSQLMAVIRIPQCWLNGIFAGLMFAFIQGFAALWCIPFMQIVYDATLNQAAGASAMLFLGAGIGSPILCGLSDYMGRRKPLMVIGTACALGLICLILYMPMKMLSMYLLLFTFAFCSSVYMIPYAVVREITPSHVSGTAMGYINMMTIMIGAPLLLPLIGWFLELTGGGSGVVGTGFFTVRDYQLALSVLPACVLLALVCVGFIKETHCQRV